MGFDEVLLGSKLVNGNSNISKSKSHKEMIWYIQETYKNGWSRSMLLNQIELKAYEHSVDKQSTSFADKNKGIDNSLKIIKEIIKTKNNTL